MFPEIFSENDLLLFDLSESVAQGAFNTSLNPVFPLDTRNLSQDANCKAFFGTIRIIQYSFQ
jgi:hypothetical protein